VVADPQLQARLADLGANVWTGTPAEFATFLTAETEKWGKVIRTANIKAE
jgi:tripartite-type tricarboxylate transporter receptor subunit TctC